jgi:hypothetical protein
MNGKKYKGVKDMRPMKFFETSAPAHFDRHRGYGAIWLEYRMEKVGGECESRH